MAKTRIKKRIIQILTVLLIVLLYTSGTLTQAKVNPEDCLDAYEECMFIYGGYLPPPENTFAQLYCSNGLAFCMLFMA